MPARAALFLLGIFHAANGLAMLAAPHWWYGAVPGVVASGPFNRHFVLDIAMAFVASGTGLVFGATSRPSAASFALAGSAWPARRALIHVNAWLMDGFPTKPEIVFSDAIGVVAVGALGLVLAVIRNNQEETRHVEIAAASSDPQIRANVRL